MLYSLPSTESATFALRRELTSIQSPFEHFPCRSHKHGYVWIVEVWVEIDRRELLPVTQPQILMRKTENLSWKKVQLTRPTVTKRSPSGQEVGNLRYRFKHVIHLSLCILFPNIFLHTCFTALYVAFLTGFPGSDHDVSSLAIQKNCWSFLTIPFRNVYPTNNPLTSFSWKFASSVDTHMWMYTHAHKHCSAHRISVLGMECEPKPSEHIRQHRRLQIQATRWTHHDIIGAQHRMLEFIEISMREFLSWCAS